VEQPLMNILDQCIDRIRAGEPVEACLNDYPDYADELRDMLHIGITLGELVTAAPVATITQDRLQQQLADRIDNRETHMQIRTREKRKRKSFSIYSLGAAAVLALIMGVGIGAFATTFRQPADENIQAEAAITAVIIDETQSGTLPIDNAEYIRPVYRYNDAAGVFMVVADGQPTAIFQLQVMNPGYRDHEYINIFAPANVSMNNVRPISLDGWTISDDDGNSFTFEGSTLPASGLRVYTGPGENNYGEVYMGRDSALWDEDDTLTLTNALGDVVLQANVGTLTYTLQSTQTMSNSIYFEDPDTASTGWMPPFMLNVDVIFPGQEGENVRISQHYGGEMPDLAGWTISDDDGNSYRIPYQDNENTSSYLSLYTESGTDEPGKYYMGFDDPIWQLDDSLTITRRSDGATYNIIVEDSIEMPWHLGNPPEAEDGAED